MKSNELIQPISMSNPIAYEGTRNSIPEEATGTNLASIAEGFPDITMKSPAEGGLPPRGQDCNGMFYLSTDQKVYLQNGGIITFSQEVSDLIGGYPKNAILDYIDSDDVFHKVQSLIDDNTFNFIETPSYIGDDEHWKEISLGGGAGTSLPLFTPIIMDRILEFKESKGYTLQGTYVYKTAVAGSRYGYPTFVQKCIEEKNTGEATQITLGTNTITMYVNANGHQFYNIADKSAVDAFYNTYGIADFYGVDEENERIFLPRNDKFIQFTTDISNVNQFNEAGLPNITGAFIAGSTSETLPTATGAFNTTTGVANRASGSVVTCRNASFDASRCSEIYGKSNTVQPPSSNKLLYYVVGNTEIESAITDVVEVTTSENDTIPLGYSTYQVNAQSSAAWLASNGQWNEGNIYTTFYNYYSNKIGDEFASGYIKESSEDYDDYDLVINQEDVTFRLPLLNGSEDLVSDNYQDLDKSQIVAGANFDIIAPKNGWVTLQVTGLTGSRSMIRVQTTSQKSYCTSPSSGTATAGVSIFCKRGDSVSVDAFGTWSSVNSFRFFPAQGNGTLYFKVANAVQNLELLNVGEILEEISDINARAHIIETYKNGTSWYRVYSDGWCEQGGVPIFEKTGTAVTFLKKFTNTDYSLLLCDFAANADSYATGIAITTDTKSTTGFTGHGWTASTTASRRGYWRASGYLAEGEY